MICRQFIKNSFYVFTRWSRKTWALFSALGKQVKIGAVALKLGDMAYKRLLVTGSFISTNYTVFRQFSMQVIETDIRQKSSFQSTQLQSIDSIENILLYKKFNQRCCS